MNYNFVVFPALNFLSKNLDVELRDSLLNPNFDRTKEEKNWELGLGTCVYIYIYLV
jgi:metallophosphoesterase superfamily enzyme